MDMIKAMIYGIVEGITEWLPVSSTGHMILLERLLPFQGVGEDFFNVFDVVIQLGAIMAVVVLFWKQIWPFGLVPKEQEQWNRSGIILKKDIWNLWLRILVSCVPAAVVGILFDDLFTALFYNPVCVALALILFGIAFIVIERRNQKSRPAINRLSEITYQTAVFIGVFQIIAAIFPGTSRSGATIIGALLIGVSREVAAEYTFFLAIPVMFGASILKIAKHGFSFTGQEMMIVVLGAMAAFTVSIIVLRFSIRYVKKHDFQVFGYYRIVLGMVVLGCGFLGIL